MKDDIKEILERPNVYSFNDECYLYFGDYNKLKDYITNLQEEKERLKELCDKYEEEHNNAFKLWKGKLKETMDETLIQKQHDRIKELEAINEEHRKLNGNLRTANNTLCEVEDFMYNQAKDYKTRNEKAIPMLEELNVKLKDILKIGIDIKEITDIKNTLQGKSDE